MYDIEDEPIETTAEMMPPSGGLPPGVGMIRTGGAYSAAMRVEKPRELPDVQRRLLDEAALAGESFYYGWAAGKDRGRDDLLPRIEGPSQALAFAAARCWGNCAVEYAPIQDGGDAWIYTAYFIDLETGFTVGRPFRQSKRWQVYGKLDAERKDDVRFQIGATKAGRNVILKALPQWLIDKAMAAAKKGVRDKIARYIERKGLPAAQDLAIGELVKLGVSEERILAKFEVAERKGLEIEALVILKGDLEAIRAGQERPEDLFPSLATEADSAVSDALGGKKQPEDENQESGAKAEDESQGEAGGEESQEEMAKPRILAMVKEKLLVEQAVTDALREAELLGPIKALKDLPADLPWPEVEPIIAKLRRRKAGRK